MVIEAGAGSKAVLINTALVTAVSPDTPEASWITYTDGSRQLTPARMSDFEDVTGFLVVTRLSGKEERPSEVMVNLANLKSANASKDEGVICLRFVQPADWDGGSHASPPVMSVRMALSELAAAMRGEAAPSPSM